MLGIKLARVAMAALVAATLISCGKQADTMAEKAATDVKDKVVADAKAVEALAKEKEAQEIAIDTYIYAYPLVTMETTRRVITNVDKPSGSKAPMGQFARLRSYPAVDDHSVTAPNADTLYNTAFLNMDGWTNVFAVPGEGTTGGDAQT